MSETKLEIKEEGAPGSRSVGRRWTRAIVREVKSRPFGYGVLAAFVVVGPVLGRMIFPEAPPSVLVVGGLAFGVYAALCAVPQKFM